jgi:ADP-ribosylglycohydrolase
MDRLRRARLSLEGLSLGDARGGFYEGLSQSRAARLDLDRLPGSIWHYTDDTNMALSIYANLRQHSAVEPHALAQSFVEHYDRSRGYGVSFHGWRARVLQGEHWESVAQQAFGGQGSAGNGGAMRVAPIGAYFADSPAELIESAALSCRITHAHPEAIAGAIAVAAAASVAWRSRTLHLSPVEFLQEVLPSVPSGQVREGLMRAIKLDSQVPMSELVDNLGNGSSVMAVDTVPFALWCAAQSLHSFEAAITLTIRGGGDVDTNCAIVGGIVALSADPQTIPASWLSHREPLPAWAIGES